ncbi:MAG: type II toxin-antitoxin system VapC family toxin [Thioploca sp.]|nr:type II toxin-antitoxin system VapC family toxin [Thioploca sp.]
MGKVNILDTNIIIYLQSGLLVDPLPKGYYAVSVITEMELLSFSPLSPEQEYWLTQFFKDISIIPCHDQVKLQTITLRRQYRLKLPDAIIAATAITTDALLLTNDSQLHKIPELCWQSLAIQEK